jgi:flagellar biosynthetic protein FliQ
MTISEAILWGQNALLTVALVSGPMLLAALVVGAFISILQAVTQVHEMTLVFVPKIAAVCFVLMVMGGWMLDQAVHFGRTAFESIQYVTE